VSKLLGEELTARQLGNTGYTIIRAPAVYGPWDRDVLFLFRLARRGIILRVRNAVREVSIIHVRDLVTALLLAAGHPAADGKIYHVSDGVPHSLDDIAAALRAAVGRGRPVRVPRFVLRLFAFAGDLQGLFTGRPAVLNTGKARESLQCGWVCDDRAIRKDLGFDSRIDLAEGFRETAAWYRKQGWL
jgi:nucleoside-diphosphate-sugar epimerase